jgi:hypothetical protein
MITGWDGGPNGETAMVPATAAGLSCVPIEQPETAQRVLGRTRAAFETLLSRPRRRVACSVSTLEAPSNLDACHTFYC